jgi:hypothetical protein
MNQTPPENINRLDWRINHLTWTTEPFTIPQTSTVIQASAAVIQTALISCGRERVGISIPNATALFLGQSKTHHEKAEYWMKKCIANKDKAGHLPDGQAFAFLENIMAAVVFAYTSLEAFVNEEVPDDYIYEAVEKNCTRSFVKEQIERSLNLNTKLGDVLPQVLKVTTPKGGTLWNDYDKLQNLRDRIIHMKTKDRDSRGEDTSSIWNALLCDPLPETYKTAKQLMKYFFDAKRDTPRWFEKCLF